MKEFDGEFPGIVAEYELAVVYEHKVVTVVDVVGRDASTAFMFSPKMTPWETANNNIEEIYAPEKAN